MAVDWLSRQDLDQSEWCLHREVFHLVAQRFRAMVLDLFASQDNHRLPRFFTKGCCKDLDALNLGKATTPSRFSS